MKFSIFLVISLLVTINFYSQDSYSGISVKSGVIKYRYNFNNMSEIQGYNTVLENKINYNYGADFTYLSHAFSLKGGVILTGKDFIQKYQKVGYYSQSATMTKPIQTTLHAKYLNADLSLGFMFVDKVKWNVAAYMSYMFGVRLVTEEETVYDELSNNPIPSQLIKDRLNDKIGAYALSVDINYYLFPKIGIVLSPFIIKESKPIDPILILDTKFTFGANLGVRYYFDS